MGTPLHLFSVLLVAMHPRVKFSLFCRLALNSAHLTAAKAKLNSVCDRVINVNLSWYQATRTGLSHSMHKQNINKNNGKYKLRLRCSCLSSDIYLLSSLECRAWRNTFHHGCRSRNIITVKHVVFNYLNQSIYFNNILQLHWCNSTKSHKIEHTQFRIGFFEEKKHLKYIILST